MKDEAARANKAAMQAMASGNMRGAEALLRDAIARERGEIRLWLNLATVRRQLQDFDGAFQALREALALDNRNFTALLMQAALLDKLGRASDAALAYAIALVQAPPEPSSTARRARPSRARARCTQSTSPSSGTTSATTSARSAMRSPGREAPPRVVHRHDPAHAQALPPGTDGVCLPGSARHRVLRTR